MKQIDRLRSLGLFDARVPRYTSYPTAPIFSPEVGARHQANALAVLNPDEPVSVYLHIPFCERLCWFCACRTQGTKTLSPVESYIGTLEQELALLKDILPAGLRMGRMHWGGGTPTILPPPLIHRLAQAVRAVIPPTEDHEFSVEIDPTMVDRAKIAALAAEGMNRASIGIQDFDPKVQEAIGRIQPFDVTKDCVEHLRAAGIHSLNADLVYGLPHQDLTRLGDTITKVLELAPDRLALFGYAHVPWVSKRQQLIDEEALPLRDEVKGMCEILGLDPLYLANEGTLVIFVPENEAQAALAAMRALPEGRGAVQVGRALDGPPGRVTMRTLFGGSRIVDMLVGEQLPRIC